MITHMEFLEAVENNDNQRVLEYAEQMVIASKFVLSQLQKCGFTDKNNHEVMRNIAVQQLANMTYIQLSKKDELLRGDWI